ncbi:MAG TPA: histidine kinase [Stenotrophomonas sp.]|jgi:sensor histidine kinase YesM
MTRKFWLLQLLGWSLFFLIAYVARPSEVDVPPAQQVGAVLALSMAGLLGSLGLRAIYLRFQANTFGDLRWLALMIAASLLGAVGIDVLLYLLLAMGAGVFPSLSALQASQPPISRAPLLAVAFVAWSLLYLAISRQSRLAQAARAEQALQLALKEAQLQRLLGQLTPHFTFNTINNIRALILRDPDGAREQLARFAATLRYQFAGRDESLVSMEEELSVVRDYLGLIRLQLGARLDYREQVDPPALAWMIPRFCLQLLVENAIKHGLGPSSLGGVLEVQAAVREGVLHIEVRNTGVLKHEHSGGTGLANLRQRLQLSFGSAAGLRLLQEDQYVLANVWIGGRA